MQTIPPDIATDRCPLCGGPNGCAMAAPADGAETTDRAPAAPCWCRAMDFPAALLAQVPPAQQRRVCICRACVQAAAR